VAEVVGVELDPFVPFSLLVPCLFVALSVILVKTLTKFAYFEMLTVCECCLFSGRPSCLTV
jgi:hypothetical protein